MTWQRYKAPIIDKVLGLRCTSFGYQYGEIVGSLSSVYFCGGDCVEDVTSHLMPHLSPHRAKHGRRPVDDGLLARVASVAVMNYQYFHSMAL